jgi:hypothetical protein
MAIELGGVTLEHLTHVNVTEQVRIVRHAVPGLAGDLAQVMGRASVEVTFSGIFYGPSAADDLTGLRQAFATAEPVDFFAEAVGEGYFAQVLIARLTVAQRAGYLDQFDYTCTVAEYVEPPEPVQNNLLGELDAGLLGEAAAFMDDVQSAIDAVSKLTDLVANMPDFGDPTTRLGGMLDEYTGILDGASAGVSALTSLRDLLK